MIESDISSRGQLNDTEWKRNSRDITIFCLSLLPSIITEAQGYDWGPYSPVINAILGILLVIINRKYNIARV